MGITNSPKFKTSSNGANAPRQTRPYCSAAAAGRQDPKDPKQKAHLHTCAVLKIRYVRNAAGEVIEGDTKTIKKQRDIWTFARTMGSGDPNWQLVATGE